MAYILGFFAADGYMWISSRGAHYFGFQITDKGLLFTIRDALGSNHKIATRIQKNSGWSTQYRLQVGSREMFTSLLLLGMTNNKTSTLAMPKVPDIYTGDFVRGYFDGDGNVWIGEIHKERKTSHKVITTTFTSGSHSFLISLKELLQECGLKGGSIVKSQRGFSRLQYSVKDSIMLSHLMYDSCDNKLLLKRKKRKFDEYIKYLRV